MKINKKGQTEDFTDWLLLVIGLIFLMIFLQLAIIQPLNNKTTESINLFGNSAKVSNYLIEKRVELEQGKVIVPKQVDLDILSIRRS